MRLKGARVLLVDDFADSSELYEFALGLEGADVTAVATASHAIAAFDVATFDVLVSDIMLAETDGYTLLRSIRAREPERGGAVAAIALTGHAYPHHREAAYEAGFDQFLAKPCSPSTLVETILAVVPEIADRSAEPDLPAPPLDGIRVLAIDDRDADLYIIERVLTARGAEVSTVASIDEALAVLRTSPPHVLVTDIVMPTGSGYELLRRIRELPEEQGGRVPAVAVTVLASSEDRSAMLASGFAEHVAKPFDADRLASIVASLAATARSK